MLLGLIALALFASVLAALIPQTVGGDLLTPCDINRGACTGSLAAARMTATLDITPKPVRPMVPLAFSLGLAKGGNPVTDAEVTLLLTMPEMLVADNQIPLLHEGGGRYGGTAVIARRDGGKNWQAEVRVVHPSAPEGRLYRIAFAFPVP